MIHNVKETDILKTGYLVKEGKNIKTWKRRFFILTESYLLYYESDKQNSKLKGCVDLSAPATCHATRGDIECLKTPSLKLETAHRVLYAYGKDVEDIESWIKALCNIFDKKDRVKTLDIHITDEAVEKLAEDVELYKKEIDNYIYTKLQTSDINDEQKTQLSYEKEFYSLILKTNVALERLSHGLQSMDEKMKRLNKKQQNSKRSQLGDMLEMRKSFMSTISPRIIARGHSNSHRHDKIPALVKRVSERKNTILRIEEGEPIREIEVVVGLDGSHKEDGVELNGESVVVLDFPRNEVVLLDKTSVDGVENVKSRSRSSTIVHVETNEEKSRINESHVGVSEGTTESTDVMAEKNGIRDESRLSYVPELKSVPYQNPRESVTFLKEDEEKFAEIMQSREVIKTSIDTDSSISEAIPKRSKSRYTTVMRTSKSPPKGDELSEMVPEQPKNVILETETYSPMINNETISGDVVVSVEPSMLDRSGSGLLVLESTESDQDPRESNFIENQHDRDIIIKLMNETLVDDYIPTSIQK